MNQTKARELVMKAWQSCGQGGSVYGECMCGQVKNRMLKSILH